MEKKKSFLIRMTPEEYELLKKCSEESGIGMSEYLRLGIGGYREPKQMPEEFRKAIRELNHIGVNLNQLVVLAHRKNYDSHQIEECLKEVMATKKVVERIALNL